MAERSEPCWILGVALSFVAALATAQDTTLRSRLFAEADRAMEAANAVSADVLAPESYAEAADHYREAEEDLERGRDVDDIRGELAEAARYFARAAEAAELAQVTLTDAISARDDAEVAGAPRFAADEWREAEEEFADAARRLEDGKLDRARRAAAEARELYRAAELLAIEANYLSGARQLIAQAYRNDVDRYAPKTLAKAESLLAEAETRLRNDRYDTDLPRSLAREANYEARHSMYLAERIEAMEDDDVTAEELLLDAERALVRIAGKLDLVAELDEGLEAPAGEILDAVDALLADRELLSQRTQRVAFLEDEMSRLEARLGEESERRQVQERIQRSFEQLASVFTREEATVLRRGNDVLVRMSLNFDSGSSVVKSEYFSLLRKIQTAIDVFPDSRVEIQGHTDSFGSDEANLELSKQRAMAVQRYLTANIDDLGATEITAVGYGETVPLANNETPEGRARNRRIDLLIRPNIDVLMQRLARN